jgi:AAA+ superfamily predicted ATPase
MQAWQRYIYNADTILFGVKLGLDFLFKVLQIEPRHPDFEFHLFN